MAEDLSWLEGVSSVVNRLNPSPDLRRVSRRLAEVRTAPVFQRLCPDSDAIFSGRASHVESDGFVREASYLPL